MESDSTREPRECQQPTAAEAREALQQLGADGEILAARTATPRWFAPAVALIVAGFVVAQVVPSPYNLLAVALGCSVIALSVTRVSTNSGVDAVQFRTLPGKWLYVAGAGFALACMAAGFVIRFLEMSPWWIAIPAVVAFCAVLLIARASARLMRRELVEPQVPST